jgi:hypothetical protein
VTLHADEIQSHRLLTPLIAGIDGTTSKTKLQFKVATWFVFKPKIQIWVHFGGYCNGRCLFYGHLVHFTVFWYILWTFGIFCGNLLYFSRFGILYQEKSGNPAAVTPTLFYKHTNR